jgi:uncharacterized protein (UPF0333 family)
MSYNAILVFILVVCVIGFATFVGLALGKVFAKQKPFIKSCSYDKCNENVSVWMKEQRGDIDNTTKQFPECTACPERSYSQITNEVKKFGVWKAYKTPEEAIQAIIL